MAKDINIEKYLQTSILEEYVMGTLPEAEAEEVHKQVSQHAELKEAVEAIEKALMGYSNLYGGDGPDNSVLDNALKAIEAEEEPAAKVIDFQEDKSQNVSNRWMYWAAAASVLLLISVALNFFLYQNWQKAGSELLALQQENTQLADENGVYQTRLETSEEFFTHLQDRNSKPVKLEGLDAAPDSKVLLSWNEKTQQTLLLNYDLPEISADEQYQLWAIIDGKPVDAGVIEKGKQTQFMKSFTGEAVQFAITVEPKGGSESPTLEKMYVAGAVG